MTDTMKIVERSGIRVLVDYTGKDEGVIIPDSVTVIGESAFSSCSSLQSVVIPDSVTQIGSYAFSGCSSLQSVVIPKGVRKIADGAFSGCSSLQSVVIPQGVTQIGSSAFSGCSSLQSVVIPDSVTQIGSEAFVCCSSLQSVVIPDSVTRIGYWAFSGCRSLQSVVIPKWVREIESRTFAGCSSLQSVVIPKGVRKIANGTFSGCSSLQSVVIPECITEIGSGAFSGCSSLRSVMIPEGVTQIDSGAFSGCSSLRFEPSSQECLILNNKLIAYTGNMSEFIVPDDAQRICSHAFSGNSSLRTVKIPTTIQHLDDYAFSSCANLHQVKIAGTLRVGGDPFWDCKQAIEIIWRHQYLGITKYNNCKLNNLTIALTDDNRKIHCRLYIPNDDTYQEFAARLLAGGVENISQFDELFRGSDAQTMEKVKLAIFRLEQPFGLSETSRNMYTRYLKSMARRILPEVICADDQPLFYWYRTNHALPLDAITDLVDLANREGRTEITAALLDYQNQNRPASAGSLFNLQPENSDKSWVTRPLSENSLAITKYRGKNLYVIIPSVVKGMNVTKIGRGVTQSIFYDHMNVEVVEISQGITHIGYATFFRCENLSSVKLPEGIIEIGSQAFEDCNNLVEINFPQGLDRIGQRAFRGCSLLASFTLPNSIRVIDNLAFEGCHINKLVIPEGVLEIGWGVFGASGNREFYLPGSLVTIKKQNFGSSDVLHVPKGTYAWKYAKGTRATVVEI